MYSGWTGQEPNWIQFSHLLESELLGSPLVNFRLRFGADFGTTFGGVAVDDISIQNGIFLLRLDLFSSVPTTPPLCAIDPFPANGATDAADQLNLAWSRDFHQQLGLLPRGYYVSFGTDNPPTNIYNVSLRIAF